MPVFFFDVLQDGKLSTDTEGSDLPDLDSAIEEAVKAMAEMSGDAIPGTRQRQLTMTIRDAHIHLVRLDMTFKVAELQTVEGRDGLEDHQERPVPVGVLQGPARKAGQER
jgi:hypothetical protein